MANQGSRPKQISGAGTATRRVRHNSAETKSELMHRAKQADVAGRSNMNKAELQKALRPN